MPKNTNEIHSHSQGNIKRQSLLTRSQLHIRNTIYNKENANLGENQQKTLPDPNQLLKEAKQNQKKSKEEQGGGEMNNWTEGIR